ncbi:MAG TPA: SAM-dependent chlorinase/fluorinase [Saprospiraceae bacterium]|nr:SAM-dependent chlorinase/fluorinase [Saprospiraceae bacterium]
MSANIITLITDYHMSDHYLAQMKGKILSDYPNSTIIDIVHQIPIDDISKAAFHLASIYKSFPIGTIHIVSIKNHYDIDPKYIVFAYQGYYFLGPDNGVFSLVFDEFEHFDIYQIDFEGISVFDAASHYTHSITFIRQGLPMEEIGPALSVPTILTPLQPVSSYFQTRVIITHIDGYGNAITNLKFEEFERVRQGRKFRLFYNPHDPISEISVSYAQVEYGEVLAQFNNDGYLELAVNNGNAAQQLHLKLGDTIQIDFVP